MLSADNRRTDKGSKLIVLINKGAEKNCTFIILCL